MSPVIAPESVLAITGTLFAVVGAALYLEGRFLWARTLSAALLALVGGLFLSNTGILPFASPAYDFVNDHFILVSIPLLLFKADMRVIFRQGGRVLVAFLISATGIIAGAGLAFALIEVPESAKYAGMLVGGYTGGGLNFVAVSQAVEMDPGLGAAALAAESLAGISYLFLLALLPTFAAVRRWLPLRGPETEAVEATHAGEEPPASASRSLPILHIAAGIGMSLLVCAAGVQLAAAVGRPRFAILAVTALAVLVANALPRRMAALKGDQELGMLLLYVFFVVYAAASRPECAPRGRRDDADLRVRRNTGSGRGLGRGCQDLSLQLRRDPHRLQRMRPGATDGGGPRCRTRMARAGDARHPYGRLRLRRRELPGLQRLRLARLTPR